MMTKTSTPQMLNLREFLAEFGPSNLNAQDSSSAGDPPAQGLLITPETFERVFEPVAGGPDAQQALALMQEQGL
jgi:hypothetical protein